MTAALPKHEISRLIAADPPLIEGYRDLETQLQPNGFDLTLREIALPQTPGRITVSNSQRAVSDLAPLVFDGLGNVELMPGAYIITFNEVVNLPTNVMALMQPRSSLLRSAVSVHGAVWDAGYSGRSRSLLVVHHPRGFRVQRNAGVAQIVFFRLSEDTEGYSGTYQGENLD
jgi:dUTP pyrophosphatase